MPQLKPWGQIWPHPGGHKFYLDLYRENFRNLPVPSHKAYGYQILHIALSGGPSLRGVSYSPKVKLIAKGHKFCMGIYCELFPNLFVRTHGYQF